MEAVIAGLFMGAGGGAAGFGWFLIFIRASSRRVNGWFAVANGLYLVADVLRGSRIWALIAASCCAYSAWLWWNSGGGDGTKRRLKSWARRFKGVRRTAPALGGA